jgi:hypothetical protein
MTIWAKCLSAITALTFSTAAYAGPPYETDDPVPTDTGKWEVLVFGGIDGIASEFHGSSGLDINYGAAPNVQLTTTILMDFEHGEASRVGVGDAEIGLKYRFYNNEAAGFSLAVFPRVILPTSGPNAGSGLVSMRLPIWAQKDFGPWSLFGGGSYTTNPGDGNRGFWSQGAVLTRSFSDRVSLGFEVNHEGPAEVGGTGVTAVQIGGVYKLSEPLSLEFAIGPGFDDDGGPAHYYGYAALGISF